MFWKHKLNTKFSASSDLLPGGDETRNGDPRQDASNAAENDSQGELDADEEDRDDAMMVVDMSH